MYIELDIPFENYIYTHILIVDGCTYTYVLYIYTYTHHHIPSKLSHSTCHFGVFPISGHFRTEMNWEIQQIGEIVPGVAMPVRWCLHRHAWLVDFRPSNERTLAVVGEDEFPLKMAYFQGPCYQRVISCHIHMLVKSPCPFLSLQTSEFFWRTRCTIPHSVYIIHVY